MCGRTDEIIVLHLNVILDHYLTNDTKIKQITTGYVDKLEM